MSSLLLNIRRGSTPFYRRLRQFVRRVLGFHVPVPRLLQLPLRAMFQARLAVLYSFRYARAILYVTPLFSSRCESAGPGLFVFAMPSVRGHTRIHIGRKVRILGKIGIASGRMLDEPTLRIGDCVIIGHDVRFSVNREVCLEDGVFIAGQSTIADNDGHPHNPDLRVQGEPVRICRRAWIGQGAQIRKGVTVGEGAIVGVNSVVVKDVPAHSIVLGAPARVTGFVRKGCPPPDEGTSSVT